MRPGSGRSLTAQDVLAYAQRISQTRTDVGGPNLCQRFVRMAFGSAGGAPTAVAAWKATPDKHTNGTPPPGAAVYWGGGAGHAAISAGNGWVYSTDWSEPGKVDLVRIDDITNKWGKPLLGWTGQTNESRIMKFNAQPIEGKGAAGKYDPVYSGNTTTQGGGVATGYSQKELRQRYGYVAAMYDGVPEIQRLVKSAIKGGWTDDEFDRRLQASKWYRNHTDAERKWATLSATQPEEAKNQVAQQRADVVNLYRNMGVPVAKERVDAIARSAVVHGWNQQQIRNAVAAELDYNPKNTYGGITGQTVDQFRDMSAAYLVPISNKTLEQWTQNVLRGEADPASFESYLKDQAKSMWDVPGMQAAIDRGVTPEDYLNPYKEMAAQTLGINPDTVNWMDPKWQQAVFRTDGKGNRTMLDLASWGKTLRTDNTYGYDKTPDALDQAAKFTNELRQMMAGA